MRRGFTLIELAVSLTLLSLFVPIAFMAGRSLQEAQFEAVAEVEAAAAMRSVSEELRRDLKTMGWPDDGALRLEGAGECPEVEYVLTEARVLERQGQAGCGPVRAIAANVRSVQRERGGVRVVFSRRVSATRERVDSYFMGFGE